MRLIGYVRVSTEDQADRGRAVAFYRQQVKQYCALYDHDLIDVVVDDISGGVRFFDRPGGGQVKAALLSGQADGFVACDLERCFRETRDGLDTVDWLEGRGLELHLVEDRIDTGDPDGYFFFTIKLAAAKRERHKIQHRTRRVMRGLREQAKPWGHPPYGTRLVNAGTDEDPDWLLYRDPDTWPMRERIVALKESEGLSYRKLAEKLNRDRVPAPGAGQARKRGQRTTTLSGRLWHVSTLQRVVKGHHDLDHIPALPAAPETAVSSGGGE